MRLIDADELIEHAWRDKLDSRELIVEMIERAPTVKNIPTQIPIDIYERLLKQEPKTTGCWEQYGDFWKGKFRCSECKKDQPKILYDEKIIGCWSDYCPNCGTRMIDPQDKEET